MKTSTFFYVSDSQKKQFKLKFDLLYHVFSYNLVFHIFYK
jgi:hypothetical protein